jgi:hypothetical protein
VRRILGCLIPITSRFQKLIELIEHDLKLISVVQVDPARPFVHFIRVYRVDA